jgi:hypothetical protein
MTPSSRGDYHIGVGDGGRERIARMDVVYLSLAEQAVGDEHNEPDCNQPDDGGRVEQVGQIHAHFGAFCLAKYNQEYIHENSRIGELC